VLSEAVSRVHSGPQAHLDTAGRIAADANQTNAVGCRWLRGGRLGRAFNTTPQFRLNLQAHAVWEVENRPASCFTFGVLTLVLISFLRGIAFLRAPPQEMPF